MAVSVVTRECLFRTGGRRLPATPQQPTTLNIDSLPAISISRSPTVPGLINFPRLNPSPTHASKTNSLRTERNARLPVPPAGQPAPSRRTLPPRTGPWSRSLEEHMTLEEAVEAGRGTRQLPVISSQPGRARGATGPANIVPSLPAVRPGTSVGFSPSREGHRTSDSEDDWC